MYKIFFKDRALYLTNRIEKDLTDDFSSIYKFGNEGELKKFIFNFEQQDSGKDAFVYYHDIEELFQRFKSCFLNIRAAGGLVWNHCGSHFLAITRLKRPDLPKGKLEAQETFYQAALREVCEECGLSPLTITNPLIPTFHVYHLKEAIVLKETRWFEMIYKGQETPIPQFTENITKAEWLPRGQAKQFIKDTYPSVREVLKAAGIK